MANFNVNDENFLKQVAEVRKAAKDVNLSADKLASQSETSFQFEDGDILEIPTQVAQVIPLTGDILKSLASDAAKGYYAFQGYVTRGGRKLPCRISAKQLFTPTVWTEAQEWADAPSNIKDDALYLAELSKGIKRFGEHGAMTLINGVPYIGNEIKVKMTVEDVMFTPLFVGIGVTPKKHTALRKREQYAVAGE